MLRVFGSQISYYTGKLETYLHFRALDYRLLPTEPHRAEIKAGAGAVQMPVVQLDDGRWMSDSTPILRWFDEQQGAPSIYPSDPAMRFVALLLEDYADEWLWRSAMHYRWSYLQDRQHASGLLADEIMVHLPLPRFIKRFMITRRQLGGFVKGDGVTEATRAHVEQGYLNALGRLEEIFSRRPYLLGHSPTIADFGFMGPMLRHFGQDPTPAEVMRNRAPGVYAWLGRMWNTRAAAQASPDILPKIDPPLASLLVEACETHLVQLRENAAAWGSGLSHYDQEVQGCRYTRVPTSRYRVWCLEELRREWRNLGTVEQRGLQEHLPESQASVLWDDFPRAESEYDPEGRAPFNRAINVFGSGVPR